MNGFATASRGVLSDFLRTVVVIDDAAYHLGEEGEPIAELKAPGRAPGKAQDAGEPPARSQSAHSLNTRVLVDSFARKGLTCAVLAPQRDEDLAALVDPVAERCDIVVFDWQLGDDDGERTLERIKALCERDCGERLRLMCVYTGEPDLAKISEKLCKEIGLKRVGDDRLLLRKGSVIVTILAKKGSLTATEYKDFLVDETEIADKLLDRFCGVTKGLLSNAVLAALAGISRQAHRIVQKFDATLDPAYLAHRIMSVPVDNVEGEILSLIASELGSVVYQSNASSHIDSAAIEQWMESAAAARINYSPLPVKNSDGPELLKQLIKFGANKKVEAASSQFVQACTQVEAHAFIKASKLTELLGGEKPQEADRRFAMLSTLETRYKDFTLRLSLGTIVHDGCRYLLCLMPRCDSVRVPASGRDFLFIRLEEKSEEVHLIVEDNGKSVDLHVSKHPYHTVIYRVVPNTDGKSIFARRGEDGKWGFAMQMPDGSSALLRWVADMKPQIAQAVANEYAAQVCRVGVAKSQWLHNLGGKK